MAQIKNGPKPKHVPQRTCIACRDVAGKRSLVRIVRTAEGVEVDLTGKKNGRGAYIHPTQACWQILLEGNRLDRALRTKINAQNREALQKAMQTLVGIDTSKS